MPSKFENVGSHYEDYKGNPFIIMKQNIKSNAGFHIQMGGLLTDALSIASHYHDRDPSSFKHASELYDSLYKVLENLSACHSFSSNKITSMDIPIALLSKRMFGLPITQYLLEHKGIVPFASLYPKLDQPKSGVRRPRSHGYIDQYINDAIISKVYGLLFPGEVVSFDKTGIEDLTKHLFWISNNAFDVGITPVIQIKLPKSNSSIEAIEDLTLQCIIDELDTLGDRSVILSLSTPVQPGIYEELLHHPNVQRTYLFMQESDLSKSNLIIRQNPGFFASVNTCLLESINHKTATKLFCDRANQNINAIFNASDYVL